MKDPSKETVLVAGATGYLGRYLIMELHKAGYRIRALARNADRLSGTGGGLSSQRAPDVRALCDDVFVGEATRPETLRGLCDGCGIVVSALGKRDFGRRPTMEEVDYQANMNVLARAKEANAAKFVFVAALGADVLRKRGLGFAQARERVVDALAESDFEWTIIRPSGFFNDMEEFFKMCLGGRGWVIGKGDKPFNPIHGADLASEIVRLMGDPSSKNGVFPMGGPDILSMRGILELGFSVLGKEPKISAVPPAIVRGASFMVRPFNPMIAGLMQTLSHLDELDMRAPQVGTHHLRDFFELLAKEAKKG